MAAICLVSTGSSACFFLGAGFFVLIAARWTSDFAFFGVACFAAILRAGLAVALPRFELFLRAATRFFALAMAISSRYIRATVISLQVNYVHYPQPIRHEGYDDPNPKAGENWHALRARAAIARHVTGHGT